MDSYDRGNSDPDSEFQAWNKSTIRSRSKLIGIADDPVTGQPVEVYGFLDDEFEGTRLTTEATDVPRWDRRIDRWP